jgi:hypothetical protein
MREWAAFTPRKIMGRNHLGGFNKDGRIIL